MPGMKVKAVCTDGREVDNVIVERHGDKDFLYGLWYDPVSQKTRKCYVGPADPEYVLRSMPAALIVRSDAWIPALREALLAAAKNVTDYRPELRGELARVLSAALEELGREEAEEERPVEAVKVERCEGEGRPREARRHSEEEEGEALPA